MWDTSDPSHYYQSLVVPTPLLTKAEKSASGLLGRLAAAFWGGSLRPCLAMALGLTAPLPRTRPLSSTPSQGTRELTVPPPGSVDIQFRGD